MRTLLGRIVRAVDLPLWRAANPEGHPLGLNNFRHLEMSKLELEAEDGVQLADTLRTLGTSPEMLNRHYADRRHQSHTLTQRVQHRLEKLESPSTSDNPPTVPASRVSKPMAHSSTSGKSPPPAPASRAISPVPSLGGDDDPMDGSTVHGAATAAEGAAAAQELDDDAIGKSNFYFKVSPLGDNHLDII